MTISDNDWSEIERVFYLVCDDPEETREVKLRELLGDRTDLIAEVKSLLDSDGLPDQTEFLAEDPLLQLLNATEGNFDTLGLTEAMLGSPPELGDFGPFILLEEIGKGGMGVVFKAQQRKPDRIVALKLLPAGRFASDDDVQLLENEATSAGRLFHPAIVPVFATGDHNQQHYIAMQYIDGVNLDQRLRESELKPRQVAELVMKIARAVQHAHDAKTIHADIKPSNILLDGKENTYISDFGLAQRLTPDGASSSVGGTPAYMPPEQARGITSELGDVYSLGAVLYRSLSGRPPNPATSIAEVARQPVDREPDPLRQLKPSVPGELETICMKCLRSDPHQRYASAGEFADDLDRFLKGEPIKARPNRLAYRIRKLVWRHKAGSAITAVAAVGLLLAVAGVAYAIATRRGALERSRDSYLVDAVGRRNSRELGQRFKALEQIKRAASLPIEIDPPKQLQLRNEAIAALALADLDFMQPLQAVVTGSCVDAKFLHYATGNAKGEVSVRSITDDKQVALLPGNGIQCVQAGFDDSGSFLAVVHLDGKRSAPLLRVWDIQATAPTVIFEVKIHGRAWAFDPREPRLLYCAASSGLYSRDLGKDGVSRMIVPDLWLTEIAFHPRLAHAAVARIGPDEVCLLDAENGVQFKRIPYQDSIGAIGWHHDGRLLAVASKENIDLWRMPSGKQLSTLRGHFSYVSKLAFSHSGNALASVDYLKQMHLWEPWGGERLLRAKSTDWIQFSNDDTQLAGARTESGVGIWKFSNAEPYKLLKSVESPRMLSSDWPDLGTWSGSFSERHGILATSSIEGITFWNPRVSSEPIGMLPVGHCTSSMFDDNGALLYSSGKSGVFRWPLGESPSTPQTLEIGPAERMDCEPQFIGHQLFVSRNSPRLGIVESSRDRAIVIDLNQREPLQEIGAESGVDSVAVSPDGNWLVTGTWSQSPSETLIYDLRSGQLARRLKTGDAWPFFSPDGTWLVTGSASKFQFWHVGDWSEGISIQRAHADLRGAAAFNSDGSLIAVAHSMLDVRLFDSASGKLVATLETRDKAVITFLAFNDNDSLLAATCQGRLVKVWDLGSIDQELKALGLEPILPNRTTASATQQVHRVVLRNEQDESNQGSRTRPNSSVAFKPVDAQASKPSSEGNDFLSKASDHASNEDWGKAIECTCKALELAPSDSLIWFDLALLYLQVGDQSRYQQHCEAMQERFADAKPIRDRILVVAACFIGECPADPKSHPFLSMFGATLVRSDRVDEGIEKLKEAINNHDAGGNPADWLFLSMAYAKQGKAKESQELVSKAREWMRKHPLDEGSWKERLKLHLLLTEATDRKDAVSTSTGNSEPPVDATDSLPLSEPKQSPLHVDSTSNPLEFGIGHAKNADWPEAARMFECAVAKSDCSARTLYFHALIQLQLGNLEEYGRACGELVGRFHASRDRREVIYTTWTCVLGPAGLGSYELVHEMLSEQIAASLVGPERHILHNTRGLMLYRMQRYPEAHAELHEAVRIHTIDGNPADWLTLAMVEHRLGNVDKAIEWYKKACLWIEGGQPGTWHDSLEYRLLRKEAERVLSE